MKLDKQELLSIEGGYFSAAFVNAFSRGISVLLEIGRSLGTSIRRLYSGKICNL